MSKFGERAARMRKEREGNLALSEGKKQIEEQPVIQTAIEENQSVTMTPAKKELVEPTPLKPEAESVVETESTPAPETEPKLETSEKKVDAGKRSARARSETKKTSPGKDEDLIMVGIRMSRQEKNKLKAIAALAGTSVQEMVRDWIKELQV